MERKRLQKEVQSAADAAGEIDWDVSVSSTIVRVIRAPAERRPSSTGGRERSRLRRHPDCRPGDSSADHGAAAVRRRGAGGTEASRAVPRESAGRSPADERPTGRPRHPCFDHAPAAPDDPGPRTGQHLSFKRYRGKRYGADRCEPDSHRSCPTHRPCIPARVALTAATKATRGPRSRPRPERARWSVSRPGILSRMPFPAHRPLPRPHGGHGRGRQRHRSPRRPTARPRTRAGIGGRRAP